ncbi:MAG: hypothetical protein RLN72_02785, partial [Henriciella sp.]
MPHGTNIQLTLDQMLKAVSVIENGFAIHGADFRLLYVNETARGHFPEFYRQLAAGNSLEESMFLSTKSIVGDVEGIDVQALSDKLCHAIKSFGTMDVQTHDERHVKATFSEMPDG